MARNRTHYLGAHTVLNGGNFSNSDRAADGQSVRTIRLTAHPDELVRDFALLLQETELKIRDNLEYMMNEQTDELYVKIQYLNDLRERIIEVIDSYPKRDEENATARLAFYNAAIACHKFHRSNFRQFY